MKPTSELVNQLRAAAKQSPSWSLVLETAANEVERLQNRESHLVNVGSVKKIKADAVRKFSDALCHSLKYEAEGLRDIEAIEAFIDDFTAEKLGRGEL